MNRVLSISPSTARKTARWRRFAEGVAMRGCANLRAQNRRRLRDLVRHCMDCVIEYQADAVEHGWDGEAGDILRGEILYGVAEGRTDAQRDRWRDVWGGYITMCIRTPLNALGDQNGGVVGFTAGDLKRVFRGRIPRWVSRGYQIAGAPDLNALDGGERLWL